MENKDINYLARYLEREIMEFKDIKKKKWKVSIGK